MFLDRIKPFFKRLHNGNEIKKEYAGPRNEYYAKVSDRYGTAQMLIIVILTIFVLVSLMINSEWVTYENVYYFFNDFGGYITSADSDIENVIYQSDSTQTFALYNGRFAVAGSTGMTMYTDSGRTALENDDMNANPRLEASERYMLMYDSGGKSFSVYSIFSEAYYETLNFPIYGASVADNGAFALITQDGSQKSTVLLYNRKFKPQKVYKRSDYVTDISVSSDGNRLAILSFDTENGEPYTNIYLTKTGRNEPYADIKISGTFPLMCEFTDKNYLTVIFDDRITAYNQNGEEISECRYDFPDGSELSGMDANRYGGTVILRNGSTYSLIAIDTDEKTVYNMNLDKAAESAKLYDGYVFIQNDGGVLRRALRSGAEAEIALEGAIGAKMLVRSETEVLICMKSNVKYLKFD